MTTRPLRSAAPPPPDKPGRFGPPAAGAPPLYRRVADALMAELTRMSGDMLPSEAELCATHGVSRITVRKALDLLVERQLVVRRRGAGTFRRAADDIGKSVVLTGYIDDVLLLNRMTVLAESQGPLPRRLAPFAGAAPRGAWKHVVGVNHITAGEPIVHVGFWFPPNLAARVTAADVEAPLPTIRQIEQTQGVRLDHARQVMDAVAAPVEVATALGLRARTPVLRARRGYLDAAGAPIELFEAHYHPDRYEFAARLYPKHG